MTASGAGKIITKNGGIGGFSTELHLVPSLDLGIVVLGELSADCR